MKSQEETGVEELRRIVRTLDYTNEGVLSPFTAEELVKIVRACWACEWDVFPDQLSDEQIAAVLERGEVPQFREDAHGQLHPAPECSCRRCYSPLDLLDLLDPVEGPFCKRRCGAPEYVIHRYTQTPLGAQQASLGSRSYRVRVEHVCLRTPEKLIELLLGRIGSWTNARWDQHARFEAGDRAADELIAWLEARDIKPHRP